MEDPTDRPEVEDHIEDPGVNEDGWRWMSEDDEDDVQEVTGSEALPTSTAEGVANPRPRGTWGGTTLYEGS